MTSYHHPLRTVLKTEYFSLYPPSASTIDIGKQTARVFPTLTDFLLTPFSKLYSVSLDNTMPSMPFERQCESFRDLLEGLPMRHQEALDSFLEECTWQEIHRMIIRLHDMPEDRFIVLTVTLANASSEKFHSYMWILIAAASSQIYSTGPFTGGDVASDDAVDDPDEAMNNAETATDTMSVLSIGDDVDQVLERPDKAEPIGDNASKIVAGSEESEVNDAAEQLLKDVVHKEAFDGYGSISEAEDHPNNGKTSFTLSLREQLFGEKGIPQDIYVMVIEELFRSVYVPGVIIPSQYVDFDGYDYFADMDTCVVKSRLLHDINPILYEKYKQHYYTHNIWYAVLSLPVFAPKMLTSN